jgi:hypothetical protein
LEFIPKTKMLPLYVPVGAFVLVPVAPAHRQLKLLLAVLETPASPVPALFEAEILPPLRMLNPTFVAIPVTTSGVGVDLNAPI